MAKFKLWVFLLLAVVVLVNGYDEQGRSRGRGGPDQGGEGWTFPPGEGGPGGGASWGGDRPGGGGSWEGGPGGGGGSWGGGPGGGSGGEGSWGWPKKDRYILQDSKLVVATAAGGMRVVKGAGGVFKQSAMHILFITMEPNSMCIPQYLDSSLIMFVHTGGVRIGSIYEDKLVEDDLKAGDLYRIQAGSAFYLVNKAEGQRLHIIAAVDTAESSDDWNAFQSFFIGGGTNPTSVLAGFGPQTLSTAFNVSYDVIGELLFSHKAGAITYLNPDHGGDQGDRGGDQGDRGGDQGDQGDRGHGDDRRRPDHGGDRGDRGDDRRRPDHGDRGGDQGDRGGDRSEATLWRRFLEQGKDEREAQMKRILPVRRKVEEKPISSWRKILNAIFGENDINKSDTSLDSYNIYDRKPDFRNDYGWSVMVDQDDYKQLNRSDIGVYLVNLTAGSMMAPHVNPTATEYGVVLSGSGNIQVVYPNGTLAMDAEVKEGDVFWIPRYFPFCQVASRTGPFVFFGFSTSAHNNWPQFLVGKGSILETMLGPEFAAAFGLSQDRLKEIINSQNSSTVLPAAAASPGGGGEDIPSGGGGGGEIAPPGSGGEDAPAGESKGKGGGGGGDVSEASLMEKMESKIRMKKSSFGYNMAMGME